jgi:hypothetical protein
VFRGLTPNQFPPEAEKKGDLLKRGVASLIGRSRADSPKAKTTAAQTYTTYADRNPSIHRQKGGFDDVLAAQHGHDEVQ